MLADKRLQFANQLGVMPPQQIGLDPLLQTEQTPLLETNDLGLSERLIRELAERPPPPEHQRLPKLRRRHLGFGPFRFLRQRLAAVEVELILVDADEIPRRLRLKALLAQHPPKLRDVDVDRFPRGPGRLVAPKRI